MLTLYRDQAILEDRAYGRVNLPVLLCLLLSAAVLLRIALAIDDWHHSAEIPPMQALPQASQTAPAIDVASVQSLQLFGGNSSPAGMAGSALLPEAAAGSELSLQGVVVANDPHNSIAFLVNNGQQRGWHVGDTLPGPAAVTLVRIEQGQVVLSHNGSEQVLRLYDSNARRKSKAHADPGATSGGPGSANHSAAAGAGSGPATDLLQAAPQQIRKAAARLAEIIEVAPAIANGQLIGYRLTPGARLKDFVQLGFKTSDVLTSVNGIALNNMANLPELYSLMNKPGDVSFSLLRDGKPLNLQMTLAP